MYEVAKDVRTISCYKNICIVGLGSIGSFLYNHLSYNEEIKKITLFDPQKVEKRNIKSSFFKEGDIGKPKVECLLKEVDPLSTKTQIFQSKYIEGETILPCCDLVVDCRDYICSRKNEIDVKFYIDERSLVIDCRQFIIRKSYSGNYNMSLQKSEIRQAAFIAYKLISTPEVLNKMLNKKTFQTLNIDETIANIFQDIKLKQSNELLYETHKGLEKINSFEDYIEPTVREARFHNIDVYIGEYQNWKKFSNEHTTITKGSSIQEILNILGNLVLKQNISIEYSMSLSYIRGKLNVLLMRETGAA